MTAVRNETARANVAAGLCRCDQRHLGHDLVADVAQAHQHAGGQAQLLQPRLEVPIGIELRGRLIACLLYTSRCV